MKLIIAASFMFLAVLPAAHSQQIEASAHHGFLAAHRNHMLHLVKRRTFGGTLSLEKEASGYKKWHHSYRLPSYGVTATFIDWGNRDELGYGIGLYPYIKFKLFQTNRLALRLKTGGGLGYVTKPWDRKENHKNTIFSSPYVVVIHLSLPLHVQLNDHWSAYMSPAITHMSNGATALPNSGGNYTAFEVGCSYRFRSDPEITPEEDAVKLRDKPGLSVLIAGNAFVKEGAFELTGRRPVGTLSLEIAKRTTEKSAWQGGLDVMYNGTLETVYSEMGRDETPHHLRIQYGLTGGYHLVFSSWEIYVKQGVYLHSELYPSGRLYHRFGVRSNISDDWMINAGIKSHFFVADYFELGIGRTLWKKD